MKTALTFDAIFAAPLRGEPVSWPDEWKEARPLKEASRRIIYHGIAGLLLDRRELLIKWPDELIRSIQECARAQAFWELRHKEVICELIEELEEQGITSVLLKGTAIAYLLYEQPFTRARGDTDLLIKHRDLDQASAVLKALGWTSLSATHGIFGDLQNQDLWRFCDAAGYEHDLDLHWEITNSSALLTAFQAEAELENAIRLTRLSPSARGSAKPRLLMHIIVNRLRHGQTGYYSIDRSEFDPDRLIWAYDIKLLSNSFDSTEWQDFVSTASAGGLAKSSLEAFEFVERNLGLVIPENIRVALTSLPQDTLPVRYFEAETVTKRALVELRATRGIRNRLSLVLARTFPKPALLRMKYPQHGNLPVAWLYLKRVVDAFITSSETNSKK